MIHIGHQNVIEISNKRLFWLSLLFYKSVDFIPPKTILNFLQIFIKWLSCNFQTLQNEIVIIHDFKHFTYWHSLPSEKKWRAIKMFLQKLCDKLQEEATNINNGNVISQKSNSILLLMRLDYIYSFILALSFTSPIVLVMKSNIEKTIKYVLHFKIFGNKKFEIRNKHWYKIKNKRYLLPNTQLDIPYELEARSLIK